MAVLLPAQAVGCSGWVAAEAAGSSSSASAVANGGVSGVGGDNVTSREAFAAQPSAQLGDRSQGQSSSVIDAAAGAGLLSGQKWAALFSEMAADGLRQRSTLGSVLLLIGAVCCIAGIVALVVIVRNFGPQKRAAAAAAAQQQQQQAALASREERGAVRSATQISFPAFNRARGGGSGQQV